MSSISKLCLVYIHGMYEQEETFSAQFHNDLKAELGVDKKGYEGPELVPIPIYWYPKVKDAMIEYPKVSPHLTRWKRRILFLGLIPLIIFSMLYISVFEARHPIENLLDIRSTLGYVFLLFLVLFFILALVSFVCGVVLSILTDREQLGILGLFFWILIYISAIWFSYNGAKEEDLLQQLIALFLFAVLIFLAVPTLLRVAAKVVDPLAIQMIWYSRGKSRNEENFTDERFSKVIRAEISGQLEKGSNVVFIAHSLGSVIAFDYIFDKDFKKARTRTRNSPCHKDFNLELDCSVRAFFSMGSPIPLFTTALLNKAKSYVCLPPDVR